jgi:hypothetical protein
MNTTIEKKIVKVFKNHKWDFDDTCVRCQLKRKRVMNNLGSYADHYWVNYKLTKDKQLCIVKQ